MKGRCLRNPAGEKKTFFCYFFSKESYQTAQSVTMTKKTAVRKDLREVQSNRKPSLYISLQVQRVANKHKSLGDSQRGTMGHGA